MNGSVIFLGLAQKAGKMEIGEEGCADAARFKRARAFLSASDAAESSVSRAAAFAETCGAVHIALPFTKEELGSVVGRGTPGMFALTDAGMASAFAKKLDAEFPGRFGDAAAALAIAAEKQVGYRAKKAQKAQNKQGFESRKRSGRTSH